jgi:hypothetical protein
MTALPIRMYRAPPIRTSAAVRACSGAAAGRVAQRERRVQRRELCCSPARIGGEAKAARPWPHHHWRGRCYLNDALPEPCDSERKPIGVTLGDSLQVPACVRGRTPTSVLCNVTLPVIPA